MSKQPYTVRDGDGSLWYLQTDGTYRIRNGSTGEWSKRWQGYKLEQIAEQFDGILSRSYDEDRESGDYQYLTRRRNIA